MTGKLHNAWNGTVIYIKIKLNQILKKYKCSVDCRSKQCLMDIQSETEPNSIRQSRPTTQKTRLY